jgi:anti-sigma factor RsiW
MSCLRDDLKSYLLGELPESERRLLEHHLDNCGDCRDEMESLRSTQAALRSLPLEEPPHRIAFVSDKIFEPKGWAWLWNSTPRLGFASAMVLAAAILLHAFVSPAPAPSAAQMAALEVRVRAEVVRSIQTELTPVMEDFQIMQRRAAVSYRASLDSGRLQ